MQIHFSTPTKNAFRYGFLDECIRRDKEREHQACNKRFVSQKRPILYLDHEGECTRFFLWMGAEEERLCPVNWEEGQCLRMRKQFPKANVIHGNILHVLEDAFDERKSKPMRTEEEPPFSGVWLDMMCNSLPVTLLRKASLVSDVLAVTLSCRGVKPTDTQAWLQHTLKHCCGMRTVSSGTYAGKSGIVNMAHSVFKSKLTNPTPSPPSRNVTKLFKSREDVVKRKREEATAHLVEKTRSVKPKKEAPPTLSVLKSYVGTTLKVPSSLWEDFDSWKHMVFTPDNKTVPCQVVGPFRNKYLKVRFFQPWDKTQLLPYDDSWYATEEVARRYMVSH